MFVHSIFITVFSAKHSTGVILMPWKLYDFLAGLFNKCFRNGSEFGFARILYSFGPTRIRSGNEVSPHIESRHFIMGLSEINIYTF